MDQIYTNCGFGSCEHQGTEHHHPFLDEGDSTGFPTGGWNEEHDKPINYRLANTPMHPTNRMKTGRNTEDFTTGHMEAKIIPFKRRGE